MKGFTVEQIEKMHTLLTNVSGGCDGVRERGLLESAILSAEQTFLGEELYPTTLEKGARLGFGLMKNHAFIDGNKRIGVLAMLVYFRLMGCHFTLTNEDVIHIGLGVASGEMDYENLVAYLKERKI